jgi:hypothetical protein
MGEGGLKLPNGMMSLGRWATHCGLVSLTGCYPQRAQCTLALR